MHCERSSNGSVHLRFEANRYLLLARYLEKSFLGTSLSSIWIAVGLFTSVVIYYSLLNVDPETEMR